MTVITSWYTMDNKVGVNLNRPVTSVTITSNPSQPEYPGVPHKRGDRVQGNGGSEWMFVMASATVSAFNLVCIDASGNAANATSALLASGVYAIGIAEFQTQNGVSVGAAAGGVANAGDFFWALIKANIGAKLNFFVSADTGSALYISSTPGRVTVTSSATVPGRLNGLMVPATVSATAGEIVMFSYILPGGLVSAQHETTA